MSANESIENLSEMSRAVHLIDGLSMCSMSVKVLAISGVERLEALKNIIQPTCIHLA